MARMIDGNALYQEFEAIPWHDSADRDLAEDMLLMMPTLTTPEIVHCQDCTYHEDGYTHWCDKWEHVCPDDSEFFCKFGRKKDGSTTD